MKRMIGLALAAALCAAQANAEELTGTLKKIKETGSITIAAQCVIMSDEALSERAVGEEPAPANNPGYATELVARDGRRVTPYLAVSVRDTGIGISTQALPHIFERSYRSEEAQNTALGTGLGLSIVKGTVEKYGGQVEVLRARYPNAVPISARRGIGLDRLADVVSQALSRVFVDLGIETGVDIEQLVSDVPSGFRTWNDALDVVGTKESWQTLRASKSLAAPVNV